MYTKQRHMTVYILMLSLFISGCGPGQLFGPTMTPTPTLTPIPPPTMTPDPFRGITSAITIQGVSIRIESVYKSLEYYVKGTSNIVTPTNPKHIFLVVIIEYTSEDGINPIDDWYSDVSVTDSSGYISRNEIFNQPNTWVFIIRKSSSNHILHLPDDNHIPIESIIK